MRSNLMKKQGGATSLFLRCFLASVLTVFAALPALAETQSRESEFEYFTDPADYRYGLLKREIVEPNKPEFTTIKEYEYDRFGNVTKVTVSDHAALTGSEQYAIADRSTETAYDDKGRFAVTVTNALGQSETWEYDTAKGIKFGVPTKQTGPNGLSTTWDYDGFGRKTLETAVDGTRTQVSYDYCNGVFGGTATCQGGASFLSTVTPQDTGGGQNGPQQVAYFDGLSRSVASEVQGFDGSWIVTLTEYDTFGRVKRSSRPHFTASGTPIWTVPTYDALGRVIQVDAPDGGVTTTAYSGLTTTVTNARLQQTITTLNERGETKSVTDNSGTTTYTYDPFGNLRAMTDPLGRVTVHRYDQRGRKTKSSDPDMGVWSYSYDVLDQLKEQTDAKGQTVSLTYDLLGRVTQRVENDLISNWTFGTDPAAKNVGKTILATSNNGYESSATFDSLGRPATSTVTIDGTPYLTSSVYNPTTGRVDTVSRPSGFTEKFVYSSLGYLSEIQDNDNSTVLWKAQTRDADLQLLSELLGSGTTIDRTYNPNTGKLATVMAGVSGNIANLEFDFDYLGNLKFRRDGNMSTGTGDLVENFYLRQQQPAGELRDCWRRQYLHEL